MMMSDDEAFEELGEIMAKVVDQWPHYSSDVVTRIQSQSYVDYCRPRYYGPTFSLSPYGLTPRI